MQPLDDPGPRWWQRIPPRVRQQTHVIVGSLMVLVLVVLLLGNARLRPVVFTEVGAEPPAIQDDVSGVVDLFDLRTPHTLTLDISDVEYTKMKADFQKEGEKTWIRADATLDGTPIPSVGIRLKGNSTLGSLRGAGAPGGLGGPPGDAGAGRPGGGMSNASFDDPSSLPLLLSFHKFVRGRGYQGRRELAIRPGMGNGANLNEAVALQLVHDSGEPSQRFTWVQLRMNGSEARTRFVIENPDQSYAEDLELGPGALFKSTSSNRFTYLGEDQTAYAEDMTQLSAKGALDLAPVIALLKFVQDADDATFARELPRWLEVESFARYVITHELLDNFDDMAGPGRNFLLWYGSDEARFRVISWDLNLALGNMAGGPGGGGPGGMHGPGPGGGAPFAFDGGAPFARGFPGDGGPPRGMGGGGGPKMGNRLKERFLAAPAFAPLIAATRAGLRALWFDSGRAAQLARDLSPRIPRTRPLDEEHVRIELGALLTKIERQTNPDAGAPDAGELDAAPMH